VYKSLQSKLTYLSLDMLKNRPTP